MQRELNQEMTLAGKAKQSRRNSKLQKANLESRTSYAVRLSCLQLTNLSSEIERELLSYKSGRFKPVWYKYTREILSPAVIALKALESVLNGVTQVKKYSSLIHDIGEELEFEYRATYLKRKHKSLWDSIQSRVQRVKKSGFQLHMKRLIREAGGDKALGLKPWSMTEKVQFGGWVFELLRRQTGFVRKYEQNRRETSKGYTTYLVEATPELLDWIRRFNEHEAMLHPVLMPVVEEPPEWQAMTGGAYHVKECRLLRRQTGMKNIQFCQVGDAAVQAINHMQSTAWEVNEDVLDVVRWGFQSDREIGKLPRNTPYELPYNHDWVNLSTEERLEWKRQRRMIHEKNDDILYHKVKALRGIGEATRLKGHDVYFPMHMDYRGRIYTYPMGPQSVEYIKALYRFREGKRIGAKGKEWLAVHGANMWGVKGSKAERVQWVQDNETGIRNTIYSPEDCNWWQGADKPWMFLAFCLDWAGVIEQGEDYVSKLPISMDGSCNGSQMMSLILRDKHLARLTNVTSNDYPEDVYTYAMDLTKEQLYTRRDLEYADGWLKVGLDRSVMKHIIMGIPNGVTHRSHVNNLMLHYDDFLRSDRGQDVFPTELFAACQELRNVILECIEPTYRNVYLLQQALRDAVNDKPLKWKSPSGFTVMQGLCGMRNTRVSTVFNGRTIQTSQYRSNGKIDMGKQRRAIAPNFVHCHDAALVHNVVSCTKVPVMTVHDCYMCLASDADTLNVALRTQIHQTYSQTDWLAEMETALDCKIDVPFGSLDFSQVLGSEYMFS